MHGNEQGESMKKEFYEDVVMNCAELLSRAHTVEAEENKEDAE